MTIVTALAISLSACARGGGPANPEQAKAQALKVANHWLKLVDAGDYTKAWSETAKSFRKQISETGWIDGLKSYRKPMGRMLGRTVAGEKYANTLSDSPRGTFGNYVVIRYKARFEHKASANETVLLTRNHKRWMVAGYFIN